MVDAAIRDLISAELRQPVGEDVHIAVRELLRQHGDAVAGVLFYGSCLRDGRYEGKLLDLYVLVRSYGDFHRSPLSAAANRLLPPNVYYLEVEAGERVVRSKYAVLSLDHLVAGARPDAFRISVWGRFSQPCALVYSQDAAISATVAEALASAVETMVREAAPLLPPTASAEELWQRAFRESYRTEFRAERSGRSVDLYAAWRERFDRIAALLTPVTAAPADGERRRRTSARWRRRRIVGRIFHVLRLAKATFTFAGGLDYILWKIETHSGVRTQPTPWQRRHPLLAAPALAVRLYRKGAFR